MVAVRNSLLFLVAISIIYAILADDAVASSPVHNLNTGYNFSTIQAAINDATTLNGHMIQVDNGIYNENIVVTKSITLRSLNGYGNTVINATNVNTPTINITANSVNISGFTITGSSGGYGVYIEDMDLQMYRTIT